MKKEAVRVGSTYNVKISDKVVPVRLTEERWTGDMHTGWIGLNTVTNRPVRIKSAAKLRGEAVAEHSEQLQPPDDQLKSKPGKKQRGAATKPPATPKKVSGLDAAAQVLKDAGRPMNFKEITDAVLVAGWRTTGKTPAATLYAAATREIAAKGKDARFRKTERGLFEHNPLSPPSSVEGE